MNKWFVFSSVMILLGAGDPWLDASEQDLHGYARAISLDLRGVVPTTDELHEIEAAGEVPDSLIDSWLYSTNFEEQVIAQHRDMFWNHLEVNLLPSRRMYRRDGIYFNNQRSRYTRRAPQTHCGVEEAVVDELNRPLTWTENDDGSISEGWVWVYPYWEPETAVEVCAFDAQLTTTSATGLDCASAEGQEEQDCGCGPNLQWCMNTNTENLIEKGFSLDLTERVRAMLQRDGSYDDLLTDRTMFLNGQTTHFFRHLSPFDTENYERPVPLEDLPEIDFNDETWRTVTMSEHHDGVLTAPGWLLRHQTNRGRANRFYGAFLCDQFILPEGGIVGLSNPETPTPDLTMREGCLGCHARLEPWAAYWGRWMEAAIVYRSADAYPAYLDECARCATTGGVCSDFCEDFYLVEPSHEDESSYVGWYTTYAFLSEDKREHPDVGPLGWYDQAQLDGTFDTCAAKNASQWLLNSEVDAATLGEWSSAFGSGQNYRSLVRSIVTSEQYWRAEP